ncbi:unnamed protein product, partial [Gulo gulo]
GFQVARFRPLGPPPSLPGSGGCSARGTRNLETTRRSCRSDLRARCPPTPWDAGSPSVIWMGSKQN